MEKHIEHFSSSFMDKLKTVFALLLILGAFPPVFAQSTWVAHSIGTNTKNLHCIFSTNPGVSATKCLSVGDSGTVLFYYSYSADWTNRPSGTTNDLLGIIWPGGGSKGIVAVGKTGTIISTEAGIWHSQTPITSKTLRALAFGKLGFVVVGDGGLIITSPDDLIWTTRISGTTQRLRSVCFPYYWGPKDSFTVVGDSGTILTSLDGITWTSQTSGTKRNLNAVARAATPYIELEPKTIAVGDSGIILTSLDGKTWTSQISGTTNDLLAIFAAEEVCRCVAVGELGTILTSIDGLTWTPQISGTTRNLNGVTWSYDSLIAVGDSGTVVTSYFRPSTGVRENKTPVKQQSISITDKLIRYSLSEPSRISITLYDTKGRFVKTLVNQSQQAGFYSADLPLDISSGIYTVAFKAGKQHIVKTIVVSR